MDRAGVFQQAESGNYFPLASGVLQRKCACGNKTVAGGGCAECGKKKNKLQRKLSIGASNDPLEREADRVADQVMGMSPDTSIKKAPMRIQRYSSQASTDGGSVPDSVNRALSTSGQPMNPVIRNDMEWRFGHNFSNVAIHTGDSASKSACDINASAYTVGNNVVFGMGQFAPGTDRGRRLLAHELTHVVQQKRSVRRVLNKTENNSAFFQKIHTAFVPVHWMFNHEEEKTYVIPKPGVSLKDVAIFIFGTSEAAKEIADKNNINSITESVEGKKLLINTVGRKPTEAAKYQFNYYTNEKHIPSGIENPDLYIQRKAQLDRSLERDYKLIVRRLDQNDYSDEGEGKVIAILKKWRREKLTSNKKRYPDGGEYLDILFVKLRGEMKDIGTWGATQKRSYYNIIFNKFDRANEVRAIRDSYRSMFRGESVEKHITIAGEVAEEAFERALGLAGIPKKPVRDFLNGASGAFSKIIKHPGAFLKNLIKSVKQGFIQFRGKFWVYLREVLMDWLFGKVGGGTLKNYSLPSILNLVLRVLGISKEYIIQRVEVAIGKKNFERIVKVRDALSIFMREGIGGLWNELEEYVGDLKKTLIEKLQHWIMIDLVKKAVAKVFKMFNPVSEIIDIIRMIYNVIEFFIEKENKITRLFHAVTTSVLDIAKGDISKAANKVEDVLRLSLSLAINLFASLMDIKIVQGIRKTIDSISSRIKNAIDKVIRKIAAGFKKLGKKAKKGAAKIKSLLFPIRNLKIGGEDHTISVENNGSSDEIVLNSSKRMTIPDFVKYAKENGYKNTKKISRLDDDYSAWTRMSKDTESKRKKKLKAYTALLNETESIWKTIPLRAKIPPSKITWGPPTLDSKGRATSVKADPLTVNGVGGSPPSENIPGYMPKDKSRGRQKIYKKSQIKAHLLHHNMHGPGKGFNLTPTSRQLNSHMFHNIEKPALEALGIRKDTLGMKRTQKLTYVATVTYQKKRKSPVDKIAKKIVVKVTDKEKLNTFNIFEEDNYTDAEGDQMENEATKK